MSEDAEALKRVDEIVESAVKLILNGESAQAARTLMRASQIDPDNTSVRDAWRRLENDQAGSTLSELCSQYLHNGSDEILGRRVLAAASKPGTTKAETEKCLQLYLDATERPAFGDRIIGCLLSTFDGQLFLASRYRNDENMIFQRLWIKGDQTSNGFVNTLLNPYAWRDEEDRSKAERGGFTLYLSKLFSPGEDDVERAMRAIARLLAVDAKKLEDIIDAEGIAILLHALNVDSPAPLRSQATLAIAKFLEASADRGQKLLADFMIAQIGKRTNDDLVIAFSAAAAVFPVAPAIAAKIFLTDGFIQELAGFATVTRSTGLRHAVLELLSAACIEQNCRKDVAKHFTPWLKEYLRIGKNEHDRVLTALVLAKTGIFQPEADSKVQNAEEQSNLVTLFKRMLWISRGQHLQNVIEGLAYASIRPQVKHNLAHDTVFLTNLFAKMESMPTGDPSIFGGMNIILNLSAFRPKLSAEEKRTEDLRAYANASKPNEDNPLIDDDQVLGRCACLMSDGVVPIIVKIGKKTTPSVLALISKIMLSLISLPKKICGSLIAEGGYEHLYRCAVLAGPDPKLFRLKHDSAHALARLLISTDPTILFTGGQQSVNDAVGALTQLLTPPEELPAEMEGRDQLARSPYTFDAFRALTNLASFEDDVCDLIATVCFPRLEAALWSKSAQADAATELICNLVQRSSVAVEKLAPAGTPEEVRTAERMLLLLWAQTSAERDQTRYAAMAAVGTLMQFTVIAQVFLRFDNNTVVDQLVEYLKGRDVQMRKLALEAICELLGIHGDGDHETATKVAGPTSARLKEIGGKEVLKAMRNSVPEDQKNAIAKCMMILRM